METSSYLFMRKRKRLNISSRIMDKRSSSGSNISIDSLENDPYKKTNRKCVSPSDENVDTILVPFYEKDVLIKVPKAMKKKSKQENIIKSKKEPQPSNSYLITKDTKKEKRTSYLDRFRKQFSPNNREKNKEEGEIRSLSPEFGDTERESFIEDDNHPASSEFYNTESYNEMYYDKIINQEIANYLEHSFEESLHFTDDIISKTPDGSAKNNLKSISEVSQRRRRVRRATVQPIQNIKLGGLGPDLEKIKPRLERARSLQRYSEKVRMENRVKIYKMSVQADIEKKAEREPSARRRSLAKNVSKNENDASYLVNKLNDEKAEKVKKEKTKSKFAVTPKIKEKSKEREPPKETRKSTEDSFSAKEASNQTQINVYKVEKKEKESKNVRGGHSVRSSARSKGMNTDKGSGSKDIPPVQISFLVNVGGVRPSSALKSLEEKHRMYQEQVKAFINSNNM